MTALLDDFGGQGYIARDYQVPGLEPFDDLVVRNIEASGHLEGIDVLRVWCAQRLVGHQR
jgi:hypothetical protein